MGWDGMGWESCRRHIYEIWCVGQRLQSNFYVFEFVGPKLVVYFDRPLVSDECKKAGLRLDFRVCLRAVDPSFIDERGETIASTRALQGKYRVPILPIVRGRLLPLRGRLLFVSVFHSCVPRDVCSLGA